MHQGASSRSRKSQAKGVHLCGFLSQRVFHSEKATYQAVATCVDMHFYDAIDACHQHSMQYPLSFKEKFSQYILGRTTNPWFFKQPQRTHTCNSGRSVKRLQTVTFDGHGAPSNNWTVLLLESKQTKNSNCAPAVIRIFLGTFCVYRHPQAKICIYI